MARAGARFKLAPIEGMVVVATVFGLDKSYPMQLFFEYGCPACGEERLLEVDQTAGARSVAHIAHMADSKYLALKALVKSPCCPDYGPFNLFAEMSEEPNSQTRIAYEYDYEAALFSNKDLSA